MLLESRTRIHAGSLCDRAYNILNDADGDPSLVFLFLLKWEEQPVLWVTSLQNKCISASAQRRVAQVQVDSLGKMGWTRLEKAPVTDME